MSDRSPSRRLAVALGALVLLLVTAAVPAAADPAPTATDGTRSTGHAPARPAIRVAAQSGTVAPDGRFSMLLNLRNAPAGSHFAVDLFARISSVDRWQRAAAGRPVDAQATFPIVPLSADAVPSQRSGFMIHLYGKGQTAPPEAAGWGWRLTEPGVYPVGIRLRAADGTELASAVTYLVRGADPGVTPPKAQVALVTPVIDGAVDRTAEAPVAARLRRGLAALLDVYDGHDTLPMSFAVGGDTAERLQDRPDDQALFSALRTAVARPTSDLLGTPYADIDAAALQANGLGDDLATQAQLGRAALQAAFDEPGDDTWWQTRPLDAVTVGRLHSAGVDHVIVPATALKSPVPMAPVPLEGASPPVSALSTGAVALPTGDDPVLAAYQFVGQAAAVASLAGRDASLVVAVDPATADPEVVDALATVLTGDDPVVTAVTVADLFSAAPTDPTPTALTAPSNPNLTGYAAGRDDLDALLASFGSMVTDPADLRTQVARPLARTAGVAVRPAERTAALATIDKQLRTRFLAVSTSSSERVTLGARDARFPLPITSKATVPLTVRISLESSDRLEFPHNDFETVINPGRTVVQIPVRTRTTGDTPMRITVSTPDGRLVLAESRYTIRSTAVSGVGVVLTVGAAGFLAVWWGRNWRRTRRSRRTPTAAVGDDTESGDDDLFVADEDVTDRSPTRSDAD